MSPSDPLTAAIANGIREAMQPQFDALKKELAELRKKIAPSDGRLVDQDRAAKLMDVSPRTVFSYAESGCLRRVRLGTSVKYDLRDIDAFIESNKSAGARQ
jgi:hypothetical protein